MLVSTIVLRDDKPMLFRSPDSASLVANRFDSEIVSSSSIFVAFRAEIVKYLSKYRKTQDAFYGRIQA